MTLKDLKESTLILSDLELPTLPYIAPITANSGFQNINYIMHTKWSGGLVERCDLSLLKSILGTTELCGGKLFDFTQSFHTAL